jgi:hypothetical protein
MKISGSASYFGGNMDAGKSEPSASTKIAEIMYNANESTEHAECATRRERPHSW